MNAEIFFFLANLSYKDQQADKSGFHCPADCRKSQPFLRSTSTCRISDCRKCYFDGWFLVAIRFCFGWEKQLTIVSPTADQASRHTLMLFCKYVYFCRSHWGGFIELSHLNDFKTFIFACQLCLCCINLTVEFTKASILQYRKSCMLL